VAGLAAHLAIGQPELPGGRLQEIDAVRRKQLAAPAPAFGDLDLDIGLAGGTPMAMRRNALVGAGYVIAAGNDIGLAFAADEGRTTPTRIASFPNLPGTYAEQVKLTIDFRHIDPDRFQAMRT